MGTIPDCLHLKVNLRKKIYLYVNSTTQRCSKLTFKTFLIEDFFHLPPVDTVRAPWIANISANFLKNRPKKTASGSRGKLIHEKIWSRRTRGNVPVRLNCVQYQRQKFLTSVRHSRVQGHPSMNSFSLVKSILVSASSGLGGIWAVSPAFAGLLPPWGKVSTRISYVSQQCHTSFA